MDAKCDCMDSFSWRRVGRVARFYFPYIKKQLIIYPAFSILGMVIVILSERVAGLGYGLFLAVNGALSMMLVFAPTIFASRNGLDVETVLPATGAEKSTFIIGYVCIVVPILLYLPVFWGMPCDMLKDNADIARVLALRSNLAISTYGFTIIENLFPISVCLYVVMKRTTNRILLGMVWSVVALISISFVGGIYGMVMAIYGRFWEKSSSDVESVMKLVTEGMESFFIVLGVILLICSIFVLYRTHKVISNRQI